jgi:hypothetical protein
MEIRKFGQFHGGKEGERIIRIIGRKRGRSASIMKEQIIMREEKKTKYLVSLGKREEEVKESCMKIILGILGEESVR